MVKIEIYLRHLVVSASVTDSCVCSVHAHMQVWFQVSNEYEFCVRNGDKILARFLFVSSTPCSCPERIEAAQTSNDRLSLSYRTASTGEAPIIVQGDGIMAVQIPGEDTLTLFCRLPKRKSATASVSE